MRKQNFSMLELIAVMIIMTILLSITSFRNPDRAKSEVSAIGAMIQLYQAKSLNLTEGEFYSIHIGDKITVTDETGFVCESKIITSPIQFLDGPITKDFLFNHVGEVEDKIKVLRFKIGGYKVRVNNFTGKFLYYDELANYSAGNSNSF